MGTKKNYHKTIDHLFKIIRSRLSVPVRNNLCITFIGQ